MGMFSTLPPEIRALIWDELLPRGRSRHKTDLAILRANSALRAEIIGHFRRAWKVIKFEVSCECHSEHYDSIHLIAKGSRSSAWDFTSADNALARGLQYLPVHKLPIHVVIMPPSRHDPGQLICAWDSLRQLVQLLQSLKRRIKHLTIHLYDKDVHLVSNRPSRWLHGKQERRFNFSIPDPSNGKSLPSFIKSDIHMLLLPFSVLQNVRRVDIRAYKELFDFPSNGFTTTGRWLKHVSRSFLADSSPTTMARKQRLVDITHGYLSCRLLSIPGKTANLLRLHRFAHWFLHDYTDHPSETDPSLVESEDPDCPIMVDIEFRLFLCDLEDYYLLRDRTFTALFVKGEVSKACFQLYPCGLPRRPCQVWCLPSFSRVFENENDCDLSMKESMRDWQLLPGAPASNTDKKRRTEYSADQKDYLVKFS